VVLVDDRLDFTPGQLVGGAHPHAGLETVTLVLEGALDDSVEGLLETGDVAWMTAGRGVVHNEYVRTIGRTRFLQLWVALPQRTRSVDPALEVVPLRTLPIRREPGVEARLYSGRTGVLVSPTRNLVPITLVDFHLQPNASVTQALPGTYSGLLYVTSGSVRAGRKRIESGEVGWLDPVGAIETELSLQADSDGARVILYAGRPVGEPLTARGPFVASSDAEIAAFYRDYRAGAFPRLSKLGRLGTPRGVAHVL
jgi:redox-sensitive bicupin YhaK (pirin superfamily)